MSQLAVQSNWLYSSMNSRLACTASHCLIVSNSAVTCQAEPTEPILNWFNAIKSRPNDYICRSHSKFISLFFSNEKFV